MTILPYLPWITANPPVLPKLYYGAISQEQRMAMLCKKIGGVEAYLKYLSESIVDFPEQIRTEVQSMIDDLEDELQEAISNLEDEVREQIAELVDWVRQQTWSVQTWDVTRGLATDSVDAMRRTFFDVTVFGTTVDQLSTSELYETVDALAQSGWNVRALAVIGAKVLAHMPDQSPWIVPGGEQEGDPFNAEDLASAIVNDDGYVVVNP